MKKIFSIIVSLLMVVVLSGCGDTTTVSTTKSTDTSTSSSTLSETSFVISFDLSYEGAPKMDDVKVIEGNTLQKPADPIREGYTFMGWMREVTGGNLLYNFDEVVREDFVLVATWEKTKIEYTVSFDLSYEGAPKMDDVKVTEGNTLQKPADPIREGYEFGGWTVFVNMTDVAYDFTKAVNSDLKLTATWDKVEVYYEVNYYFNYEENADFIPTSILSGEKADSKIVPGITREWFTFTNWYLDSKCTILFDFETKIEKDTNLYAGWFEDPKHYHTVLFFYEKAMTNIYMELKVVDSKTLTKPTDPLKTGRTFAYWANPDGSKYDFSTEVKVDNNLYAVWKDIIVTRDLNYDGAMVLPPINLSESGKITDYITYDSTNAPTRNSGYYFANWCIDKACTKIIDPETFYVESDITIYAKWGNNEFAEYTKVNFYNNYDEADTSFYLEKFEWQRTYLLTKPEDPKREGYDFIGWYTEKAGTNLFDFEKTVITEFTTNLYAKWEKQVVKYTVTFDYNYEGSIDDLVTVVENTAVMMPSVSSREGYIFKGWRMDINDTSYYDATSLVTNSFTLYAIWYLEAPQFVELISNPLSSAYFIGLTMDGSLYIYGDDVNYGIMGDGEEYHDDIEAFIPFRPQGIDGKIAHIFAGTTQCWFALTEENNLYIMGTFYIAKFKDADGKNLTACKIPGKYTKVCVNNGGSNEGSYALMLGVDGKIYGFGTDFFGQLGDGESFDLYTVKGIGDTASSLIQVSSTETFVDIAVNKHNTSYAIDSKGQLWGWGNAVYEFYLGVPKTDSRVSVKNYKYSISTPIKINGPEGVIFKKVFVSYENIFLVDSNGKLFAMGTNFYGELGVVESTGDQYGAGIQPQFGIQTSPVLVSIIPGTEKVVSISQNWHKTTNYDQVVTTAVLTESGNIYTFGVSRVNSSNMPYYLGVGQINFQSEEDLAKGWPFDYTTDARLVSGNFKSIMWYWDADNGTAIALDQNGEIYVWGYANGFKGNNLTFPYLESTTYIYNPTLAS